MSVTSLHYFTEKLKLLLIYKKCTYFNSFLHWWVLHHGSQDVATTTSQWLLIVGQAQGGCGITRRQDNTETTQREGSDQGWMQSGHPLLVEIWREQQLSLAFVLSKSSASISVQTVRSGLKKTEKHSASTALP